MSEFTNLLIDWNQISLSSISSMPTFPALLAYILLYKLVTANEKKRMVLKDMFFGKLKYVQEKMVILIFVNFEGM